MLLRSNMIFQINLFQRTCRNFPFQFLFYSEILLAQCDSQQWCQQVCEQWGGIGPGVGLQLWGRKAGLAEQGQDCCPCISNVRDVGRTHLLLCTCIEPLGQSGNFTCFWLVEGKAYEVDVQIPCSPAQTSYP